MKDRIVRELKTFLALLVICVIFSVLFILGHLVFYGDMPRWK